MSDDADVTKRLGETVANDADPLATVPGDTARFHLTHETQVTQAVPRGARDSDLGPLGPDTAKRYEVRQELGRGGMGSVYCAYDRDIRRQVALKVMHANKASGRPRHRFVEELQLTGQLEHPGIVPVHDAGVQDGRAWYTMRLVEGDTLKAIIKRLKGGDPQAHAFWSFERRVQLFLQLLNAAGYAHEQGVLHRDIKPANIMVGEHGEAFLVDWGIARPVGDSADDSSLESLRFDLSDPDVTVEGTVLGTPSYMAPEQAAGRTDQVGPRSDLYSLAVVLYELLALQHPLHPINKSKNAAELLARVQLEVPPAAETVVNPHQRLVPRPLSLVLEKALAKAPDARFETADAFGDALMRVVEGRHPVVCTTTGLLRVLSALERAVDKNHKLVILATALFLLSCVVGAAVIVLLLIDAALN